MNFKFFKIHKKFIPLLSAALIVISVQSPLLAQEESKEDTKEEAIDSKNKDKGNSKIKKYEDVITDRAISDEGVFTVHKVNENYFYEIPINQLNKDMLLVTRVVKLPTSSSRLHAGKKTSEILVNWQRYKDYILIKVKDYIANANVEDPINISVNNNYYNPTLYSFPIKAFNQDSTSVVIDVTKFYSKEVEGMNGVPDYYRESFKIGNLDASRSFIDTVKSFPKNIEVIQNFTYKAKNVPVYRSINTFSIQVNQSMILLPDNLMQPRLYDERVGWFNVDKIDYSSEALKSDEVSYIKRWRLIPKDIEAYNRGELVEPVKPIVYYIDPATPEKFRPYFKAGIELWQKAFETAGFKNAIIAKDPPTKEEDPNFSPEDVRYSVVRYIATEARNASGPSVADPRTGEIIESDILWYHNHLKSYRNRYLIETAAANPRARTLDTPLEDIGEMMKMVIAHEVGHTLGLPHNMAASYAYNVEDYRNGSFTQKNGIAASIMDYARFNYIAQPGDEGIRFIRQLGPYDKYAVNWGYRYFANTENPKQEVPLLNKLIEENANDPKFKYSNTSIIDPSAQTEDVGNNAMKASSYGVSNLKIVAENLEEWTSDGTNNYADLKELHKELVTAYRRYVRHVVTNVGGVYEQQKKPSQAGEVFTVVPKELQREAVNWLHDYVFLTPNWLLNPQTLNKIENEGFVNEMSNLQVGYLNQLVNKNRLGRLMDYYTLNETNYSPTQFIEDVRTGIWSEVDSKSEISVYRRNLQKAYANLFIELKNENRTNDVGSLARGELMTLKDILKNSWKRVDNLLTKFHLETLYNQIVEELELH